MEKKKNIVLVLLFIIIAVMACFGIKMSKDIFELKKGTNQNINTNQNDNNNNVIDNNQNTNNDQNNVVNLNEEKELTDIYVKNDVSKKTSIMLTKGYNDNEADLVNSNVASNLIKITDNEKLGIILTANKDKFIDLNATQVEEKVPSLYDKNVNTVDQFLNDGYVKKIISGEIIDDEYMKMYNIKTINIEKNNFGEKCPQFQYDKVTNYYLSLWGCGGTGYPFYQFYKYKYTIKGNNVYVYVASSVMLPGMKVYKGIEEDENNYLYTATSDNQVENDMKSNPEKYGLYKLTFEKNNEGMYYYKTTEKIN